MISNIKSFWHKNIAVIYFALLLICSFLYTLSFKNYFFIPVSVYIISFFAVFTLICAIIFLKYIYQKGTVAVSINPIDGALFTFIIYYIIRYHSSIEYQLLVDNYYLYLIYGISYLYLRISFSTIKFSYIRILHIIIGAGSVQAIYSLLQKWGILPTLFNFDMGGSFMNPGDLANFMCIPYTLSLVLVLSETKRKLRIVYASIYLLHLVVIIISMARTAWLSCIVVSSLALFWFYFQYLIKLYNKLVKTRTIYPLALALLLVVPFTAYKVYSLKPDSASGRVFIWKLSSELITEKPLFGHGYESFMSVMCQKQIEYFSENPNDEANGLIADNPMFAFNDFLETGVEIGIVGVLLIALIGLLAFYQKAEPSHKNQYIHLACKLGLVSVCVCMLFSYPLWNNSILIMCFALLAIIANTSTHSFNKLNLRKIYLIPVLLLLLVLSIIQMQYSYNSIKYGLLWKRAFTNIRNDIEACVPLYNEASKHLKHNMSFQLNYSGSLYHNGAYPAACEKLETFGYLIASTDMFIMLAQTYKQMGNYTKAEENFKKASLLIPHRFIPKHELFKLYKETEQPLKALHMAKEIQQMKIKVHSSDVMNIKNDAYGYIIKHEENISDLPGSNRYQ